MMTLSNGNIFRVTGEFPTQRTSSGKCFHLMTSSFIDNWRAEFIVGNTNIYLEFCHLPTQKWCWQIKCQPMEEHACFFFCIGNTVLSDDMAPQGDKTSTTMVLTYSDSKVHGANMWPIWGRQGPGGPHVGPMNFTISVVIPEYSGRSQFVDKRTILLLYVRLP